MHAELGTIEVDNPFYQPGHPTPRRVMAVRTLRDDPLGNMHDRGQITEPQYRAGRQVQADYENSGQGRMPGQDTTREPVDGGGGTLRGITDRQLRARDSLVRWQSTLDARGWELARAVLIDKLSVREATQRLYGEASAGNVKYAGRRFRECLDMLAARMGLVT